MNLQYRKLILSIPISKGYGINYPNIAFYRYLKIYLPDGIYKDQLLGLFFCGLSREVTNNPSGIKIEKIYYEFKV